MTSNELGAFGNYIETETGAKKGIYLTINLGRTYTNYKLMDSEETQESLFPQSESLLKDTFLKIDPTTGQVKYF